MWTIISYIYTGFVAFLVVLLIAGYIIKDQEDVRLDRIKKGYRDDD